MFFSFSLASYYTFSSLIRNGQQFLGFGRAHYVLPSGHFGLRPPFQDHKRKPSSKELPIEDASLLLRLTPGRALFLDEIHKNFLDFTLIDQQEIFVDFLLKEYQNCLHRGLTPDFNDVGRFSSLDKKNDPNYVFAFEGQFGILPSPTGENTYDAETPQQSAPFITTNRLTTSTAPSYTIKFPETSTSLRNDDFFISRRSFTSHALVNSAYHQSLPVAFVGSANYSPSITSAPERYRFTVQHKTLSTTFSFCRRSGNWVSYLSLPVTFRVTKFSLATKRNCVSVIIFKVNKSVGTRGRDFVQRPFTVYESLNIRRAVKVHFDNTKCNYSLLPSCRDNDPLRNVTSHQSLPVVLHDISIYADNILSAPERYQFTVQSKDRNIAIFFCRRLGQYISYRSMPASLRVAKIFLPEKRKCVSLTIYKVIPFAVPGRGLGDDVTRDIIQKPISNGRLTPAVPPTVVPPCSNRLTVGKVEANPLSTRGFDQSHQQRSFGMKLENGTNCFNNMVASTTGQSASNLGAGVIGGHVKTATDCYDPFGWGANTGWAIGGLFQPLGNTNSSEGLRNPFAGVMNGAANTKSPPRNRNEPVQQGAPCATLWESSKPGSAGRRRSSHPLLNDQSLNQAASSMLATNNNFGRRTAKEGNQRSSHSLLDSTTTNHAAKPSSDKHNFGLLLAQQAAGLGFISAGDSPLVPKLSSGAKISTPRSLSMRSALHNNRDSSRYTLPASCPVIPWSDLEDAIDRRTNKPKTLGSGTFGVVKLMRQKSSGKMCAVKFNQNNIDNETVIENLKSELDVLTTLKDLQCVPQLYGVTWPGSNTSPPLIVQEFIGDPNTFRSMTLSLAIRAKVLPQLKAKRVALRVSEAIRDIHRKNLIHCDLKVDNIMLEPGFVRKDNPAVKIIDFGASAKIDGPALYHHNTQEQIERMLKYSRQIAPEVVRGENPYNVTSDIYGLGIILKDMSRRFRGFLWKLGDECTDADYRKRPSIEDVINRIKTHLTSIQGAADRLAAAP